MSRALKIKLPCRRELNFHVFPVSAFNRDFWLNLERLGRLLGSTWSFLGASWPQLGRSWDQLGGNLGAPGTNLAPTWALGGQVGMNLNPHWAIMGDLVTLLERSWSLLGASRPFKGDLGLILVPPRRILAHHRHDFDVYEALFWSLWRSFLVSNQRRHSTSKAHQATMTNHDSRQRHYNDDATTAQVGKGVPDDSLLSFGRPPGASSNLLGAIFVAGSYPRTVR